MTYFINLILVFVLHTYFSSTLIFPNPIFCPLNTVTNTTKISFTFFGFWTSSLIFFWFSWNVTVSFEFRNGTDQICSVLVVILKILFHFFLFWKIQKDPFFKRALTKTLFTYMDFRIYKLRKIIEVCNF